MALREGCEWLVWLSPSAAVLLGNGAGCHGLGLQGEGVVLSPVCHLLPFQLMGYRLLFPWLGGFPAHLLWGGQSCAGCCSHGGRRDEHAHPSLLSRMGSG